MSVPFRCLYNPQIDTGERLAAAVVEVEHDEITGTAAQIILDDGDPIVIQADDMEAGNLATEKAAAAIRDAIAAAYELGREHGRASR